MSMIEQLIITKDRFAKQKSELVGYVLHQLKAYKSGAVQRYTDNISFFEEHISRNLLTKNNNNSHATAVSPTDDKNLQFDPSPEEFVGEWLLVSQKIINEFAAVTRDEQWIHLDVARAQRELPCKSTVAHGFLILSLVPVLTAHRQFFDTKGKPVKSIINCGLLEVQFLAPLKSETSVRAKTKRLSVESQKNGYKVTEEVVIETNAHKSICRAVVIYRLIF
ncbi:MaoC/PaaZ C-terminal domain-containing protein [Cellvibrio sp. OA-2007]|uniref:MaoC/PaaZ C-terminal domain-containing protein n=1 Tax=Cellvibrio sp. OA-2007 TaxID=529823 RepID=UPI0007838E2E|nr:MaoC/PaaZ C-terminal domain-containing protein [Cellvibrio sp. OA-2007]